MSNHSKGGAAEREAALILADLTGFPVRRKLGAGRLDDEGDLEGIPETTVQVAWWPTRGVLRAVREKPPQAEQQAINAGTPFSAAMIRMHGGVWRIVLTPEAFATLLREATS